MAGAAGAAAADVTAIDVGSSAWFGLLFKDAPPIQGEILFILKKRGPRKIRFRLDRPRKVNNSERI
jgi:hypothetical protein